MSSFTSKYHLQPQPGTSPGPGRDRGGSDRNGAWPAA